MRQLFEPKTTPIVERVKALEQLHHAGIKTFAMIAPLLPGAEKLVTILKGKAGYIIVDKMNYHYGDWVYRKYGLKSNKSGFAIARVCNELVSGLKNRVLIARYYLTNKMA
ncbi:MAG: hypothetical protein JSV32_08565 [Dehalococcoidia bacterium]|nr:MAG: hypothetical protein JSV32_08565 [Dehalococcoidia bacterium]